MKHYTGLSQAESYAENSSKKHNATRYVTKSMILNVGVVYYVYEKQEDIDKWGKLISVFKNGERQ